MLKVVKASSLFLSILLAAVLLVGLSYALGHGLPGVLPVGRQVRQVYATTSDENYSIVLDVSDAPASGRAAPYGQWIVTHNSVAGITTTLNYGTVARTNGYDPLKSVICYNSGAYTATLNLYLRTSSTGSLYGQRTAWTDVVAGARKVITYTDIAPWTSLGITSTDATTGTTMLCGIYVQTP